MDADLDRSTSPVSWTPLVGYLVLWFGLVVFLAVLVLTGQLRQAEDAFKSRAATIYLDIDNRLSANESVLDGAAAFLRVVGQADRGGLESYAQQVLQRFPHVYKLSVQRRVGHEQLPALLDEMRAQGFPAFALHRASAADPRHSEPVPDKDFYLPTVMTVPARPDSSHWLGLDVDEIEVLRSAVAGSISRNRAVASGLFALSDGAPAYMLVRPVLDPVQPDYQTLMVSLVIRVVDLLPPSESLYGGMEVQLRPARDLGDDETAWVRRGGDSASALERRLFPRLQQVRIFGTEAQPFVLTVRQQLGWWVIDPAVATAFGLASLAGFFMAFAYGRSRIRREQERRASEQRLYHLANFDSLTGLPNRNLCRDRLQQALARARRRGTAVALFFLDLDGFKAVNDNAGHEAGDKLLTLVAERLSRSVREQDTVARLAGDEFVVLLEDVNSRADAERVQLQLRDAFIEPFTIDAFQFMITASIGLAMYPDDGEDAASLLRGADERMYAIKHPEWVVAGRALLRREHG